MALAAVLARAATRLLRGGVPPAAASPVLSLRSRLFCGRPADDEPSAPGGAEAEPWEAEILRDVQPVVELVKEILHSGRIVEPELSLVLAIAIKILEDSTF